MSIQHTRRELPVHNIEGADFIVDIAKGKLIQADDPGNTIYFEDLTDKGTHYEMLYDVRDKNEPPGVGPMSKYMIDIRIPMMRELDPQGMAETYGYTVAELEGKTDFEIIVDQKLLAQRRNGILPQISIGGDRFFIVLKDNELWPAGHRGPNIELDELKFDPDRRVYEGFYDEAKKRIVKIDPKLTGFPDHVVAIRIPCRDQLDPVFSAFTNEWKERRLLRQYPLQKELKAEVLPLGETNVPALIQRNREQLQQEHHANAKKIRPKQRQRF